MRIQRIVFWKKLFCKTRNNHTRILWIETKTLKKNFAKVFSFIKLQYYENIPEIVPLLIISWGLWQNPFSLHLTYCLQLSKKNYPALDFLDIFENATENYYSLNHWQKKVKWRFIPKKIFIINLSKLLIKKLECFA